MDNNIREILGTATEMASELESFAKAAEEAGSPMPELRELIDRYSEQLNQYETPSSQNLISMDNIYIDDIPFLQEQAD